MVRPIGPKTPDRSEGPREVSRRMLSGANLATQAVRGHFFTLKEGGNSLSGRVSSKPHSSDKSERLFNKHTSSAGKKKKR